MIFEIQRDGKAAPKAGNQAAAVRDAVRHGRFEHPHDTVLVALTVSGVALGVLLLVLVLVQF